MSPEEEREAERDGGGVQGGGEKEQDADTKAEGDGIRICRLETQVQESGYSLWEFIKETEEIDHNGYQQELYLIIFRA